MKSRLLYSLLGSLVVTGSILAAINAVLAWAPEGKASDWAQRALLAPGRALQERLEDSRDFRRWRKKSRKAVASGREQLEEAADRLGQPHLYNAGAWAAAGFIFCFLMTLVFGVSSFRSAVAMGLKAAVALLFLQAALVFAGAYAYQNLSGG